MCVTIPRTTRTDLVQGNKKLVETHNKDEGVGRGPGSEETSLKGLPKVRSRTVLSILDGGAIVYRLPPNPTTVIGREGVTDS